MRLYWTVYVVLLVTSIMVTLMIKSHITIDQLKMKTVYFQKLIPDKFISRHNLVLKFKHLREMTKEDSETTPDAPYPTQMVLEWDVTTSDCKANYSLAKTKWFKSLAREFQNYMLYRHCRYFPILMNHPEKCYEDTYLLVIIKSVIIHHDRRELIRKTWGKEQEIDGKKIRTLFLLGEAPDDVELAHHQKLLEYENEIFGDILQWDFLDSFYNLTLKETHFLKWFSTYCHKVQYVFKGDDDIFVNIPNIIEYLKETQVNNLFVGDVIFSAKPIRNQASKYYIPKELYSKPRYPPYAGGGGFIMDGGLTRKLYMASQSIELYPIDDVFLGMCLKSLQVRPVKHSAFKTFGLVKDKSSMLNKEPCFFKSLIVVHKLLPTELMKMWELINRDLICTHKYEFVHLVAEES